MALNLDQSNNVANNARGIGQNAINSFNPQDVANTQRSNTSGLFSSQLGGTNDFIDSYKGAANSNNLGDLYNKANEIYNVEPLAQNANYLQNQVAFQPQYQTQRARGFDFSQPQIQNATNYALERLSPMSSLAQAQLQTAQGLAQGYVSAGQQQKAFELQPYQTQGQMLNDAFARQSTGFNQAAQMELDGLIQKMNAGVTLSQAEYERANKLAEMETSYQNAITAANASQNVAKINQSNVILPTGATYYNPASGTAYNPFVKVK